MIVDDNEFIVIEIENPHRCTTEFGHDRYGRLQIKRFTCGCSAEESEFELVSSGKKDE